MTESNLVPLLNRDGHAEVEMLLEELLQQVLGGSPTEQARGKILGTALKIGLRILADDAEPMRGTLMNAWPAQAADARAALAHACADMLSNPVESRSVSVAKQVMRDLAAFPEGLDKYPNTTNAIRALSVADHHAWEGQPGGALHELRHMAVLNARAQLRPTLAAVSKMAHLEPDRP